MDLLAATDDEEASFEAGTDRGADRLAPADWTAPDPAAVGPASPGVITP